MRTCYHVSPRVSARLQRLGVEDPTRRESQTPPAMMSLEEKKLNEIIYKEEKIT